MIRVIKIISENEIILNIGGATRPSIRYGDILEIYTESNESVIDPFNGEDLGKLSIVKAHVVPKSISNRFCICNNFKNSFEPLKRAISGEILNTSPLPLNVNIQDISGDFSHTANKEICVGDYARFSNHRKTE